MDRLVGRRVKVVFSDDDIEKAVQGNLDSHDEMFLYLTGNQGDPLVIGKRAIVSIMPVGED
jgi:hypothetical protein